MLINPFYHNRLALVNCLTNYDIIFTIYRIGRIKIASFFKQIFKVRPHFHTEVSPIVMSGTSAPSPTLSTIPSDIIRIVLSKHGQPIDSLRLVRF